MGSSVGDYEVFLSFRGKDTRQGFSDILYKYLSDAKIRVFRDDKGLRIGDKIDSILEFIENSKICIPIFSPNFVQSKYCLLEVTKMVELKKTIVPIFYNYVTTDDVKLKTPLYVDDFQKLEEKYEKHEVDKWKEALKEAVSYKGKKVGDKGYCEFCEEFVDEVLSMLGPRELEVVSVGIDDMCGIGTAPAPAPTGMTPIAATVLGHEFEASNDVKLKTPLYSNVLRDLEDTNGWYDEVQMRMQTLTEVISNKGDSNSSEMGSSTGDYEVFLSFRGRQEFTDVLYEYMSHAKICVYRDDNGLRIGDNIDSIFTAIANSKICIPIFSQNFVLSKHCLRLVTKMVELKKTIIPIFCNVTSDDVKLKTSLYVHDFKKLEEKYGNDEVGKWKDALKEVTSYKGRKLGVKGYSQFCEELVVELLSKLRSTSDLESSSSSHQEAVSVGIDGKRRGGATLGAPVTVLGQEFVVSHTINLIFRKAGVFNIDVTDIPTIKFETKIHLLKLTYELLDDSGKTLVTLRQKYYRSDVHAFRGKSTHKKDFLFKMKSPIETDVKIEGAIIKSYVYMAQNSNDDVWDYMLMCCCSEKTCVIYAGDTNDIIALIMPNKGTVQTAMIEIDHLVVTVYPGIDFAFIAALLRSASIDRWLTF